MSIIELYTEEEVKFREEVREWVHKNIEPIADQVEKTDRYPREVFHELGKRGYIGSLFPPEYGGTGKGLVYDTIIGEELGKVCASIDMSRNGHILSNIPLIRFGSHELNSKYLRSMARGEKIGALCITEKNVGSDAAGMETTAKKDGNFYNINGEKRFITNGSQADYLTVFAITDPSVHAHIGMSTFIVEADTPGVEVIEDFELMGMRGCRNSHLKFTNVKVPKENLVGKENHGFIQLMDELDTERIVVTAACLGTAERALEIAAGYSAERVQFGKPIKNFEGVNFKIADMAVKIHASRLMLLRTARMIDRGIRVSKESAMTKLYLSEAAFEVSNMALQILGGIGYTKKYPLERFVRDLRIAMIGAGSSEIMRFLIQREVYKELLEKS
ncbi:MAG: acyl-CoA dehydrogenase family protein [Candidatus Jordarchaeum sp.]|uniref:acyl-CoA dehydrogenase family protein n=1 Tax=Candidatus Jordarchaeum sp. TaxID=2823881 RepID=UPI00404ACD96